MPFNWIQMKDKEPVDGQTCLTKMKHGFISGTYNAKDKTFRGYYWHDLEWYGHAWVPIEKIK